jgi:hypothetical protein
MYSEKAAASSDATNDLPDTDAEPGASPDVSSQEEYDCAIVPKY